MWGLVVRGSAREALDASLTRERGTAFAYADHLRGHLRPRKMMTSGGPDKKVQQVGVVCICLSIPFFSLTFSAVIRSHLGWTLVREKLQRFIVIIKTTTVTHYCNYYHCLNLTVFTK